MKNRLKSLIKSFFKSMGLFISNQNFDKLAGFELSHDLKVLIKKTNPICFDVGANEGQTIDFLNKHLKNPVIFAFEPAMSTYNTLKFEHPNANIYQYALGSSPGKNEFKNYENSELSSFLDINRNSLDHNFGTVKVSSIEIATIETLDNFCIKHNIPYIDLLKIDTQGYDLEVLKGGANYFSEHKIEHILIELNFSQIYENQSSPYEIIEFLNKNGMHLIDYYEKCRREDGLIAWVSALFKLESKLLLKN